MVLAIGVIWAIRIFISHPASLDALWLTSGPRETAALGLLAWLHSKWQRSVTLR
jgi:hypothetical protein